MTDEEKNYILKYLSYNSDTGKISRTDRKNSNGSYDKDGYLILKIKGRQYKAHRLAYFLYYKKEPDGEIDHINRIRDDNRICNLRNVDRQTNIDNTKRFRNINTNEYGIYIDKTKGLKKKYAFKIKNKTYRCYSIEDAVILRRKLLDECIY